MIGIKLDNEDQFIDLDDDTTIEIELNNPILGDAEKLSPGSSSLPFTLPGGEKSPKNSEQLKHPDVIETSDVYQPQKATVSFNRIDFKKGQIKVDGDDNNTIDAYLLFGLSNIKDDIKTKKLAELLDEEIVFNEGSYVKKALIFLNRNDYELSVTVNGEDYQYSETDNIIDLINADGLAAEDGTLVAYAEINPVYPMNGAGYLGIIITMGTYVGSVFTPSPDPLTELSIQLKGNQVAFKYHAYWDLSGYQEAMSSSLLNYLNDENFDERIVFPRVATIDVEGLDRYYGESVHYTNQKSGALATFINESSFTYVSTGFTTPAITIKYAINFNEFQGFLRVKYIFKKIEEYIGTTFEGDFMPAIERMVLDNSVLLSVLQDFVPYGYFREFTKWAFPRSKVNLTELIPDVTVIDFIKAFASRYNLAVYQNELNGKIVMQYRENISKSKLYENIDGIAGRKGKGEQNKITGYSLIVNSEPSDLFSKQDTFIVGSSQEEIPVTLSSYQTFIPYSGYDSLGAPIANRKRGAKFGLRIFWLWDNPGSSSTIPIAVVDPAFDGNVPKPETAQLLNEKYFKYWLLFYKNRQTIPLRVNWSFNDLRRFDWTKKRMFNRSLYLVDSIKIQISKSLFKVTEAILRTQR